jgi:hypothetical protein
MAKRRTTGGGDPSNNKQPILICLGICIPLIIALGVATYFGFAGQKEREDKAAAAAADRAKADKERETAAKEAALLRAYVGLPLGKDESYPAVFHDDPQAATIVKELDQDPGWDGVQRKPKDTLRNEIATLRNELQAARAAKAKLDADTAKAIADLRNSFATNKTSEDDLRKKLDEAQAATLKAQQDKLDALVKAQGEINRLRDEIDDIKKKAELARGDQQATISKLTKEKKTLDQRLTAAEVKIAPVYLPDFEKPKGKIDDIDRDSRFAYINIGAADGVKPLLTFSVYHADPEGRVDLYRAEGNQEERDKKRAAHEPVPKGTIEVVSILGPHSSKARITNVRNLNRDPLLRGDFIFNPVWTPNQHMHVAVTGMINLTGDGRDRSAEFIQSLQRTGVVIDSYLDTKDLQIKGPGMTVNTSYLVIGESPEQNAMLALGGSSIGDRATKMDELINQMKNQAKDLGISMMTARNFMTLAGYRIPKQVTPFAGASGFGTLGGATAEGKEEGGKDAPKEKPKAKAKEPAKDKDMDEEKKDADKAKAKDKEADKDKEGKEKEK